MDENHDPETEALIDRLVGFWVKNETKFRPGATPEQIESFETRYQVHMPPDLRAYFARVDGMEQFDCDREMFSFYSLNNVKSVPEELAHFCGIPDYQGIVRTLPDPDRWFVIVDFMISSAVFAIRLSNDPLNTPVECVVGSDHHVVASSFSDFMERYLEDSFGLTC